MTREQAEAIMRDGFDKASRFFQVAREAPKGSPLHEEMKHAILEALSWTNDDEVIDALYDADMREEGCS